MKGLLVPARLYAQSRRVFWIEHVIQKLLLPRQTGLDRCVGISATADACILLQRNLGYARLRLTPSVLKNNLFGLGEELTRKIINKESEVVNGV